jgi:sulfate permease, SulP family
VALSDQTRDEVRAELRQADTTPPPWQPAGAARWLAVLRWLPGYRRQLLGGDVVAGATVAAMLVPQAMAYALLAGLPPEVGLYAAILPLAAYALFGTSRQLAVGPVAIVSLLTASALSPYAEEGTAAYLAAAALLALLVGAVHLLLGVARAGFVVNLLSHPVLVGFTSAAALVIGVSQAPRLVGLDVASADGFGPSVVAVIRGLDTMEVTTAAVGLASVALLLLLGRWLPRVPAALAVMAGAVVVVSLSGANVPTVGEIPAGLPAFGLPDLGGALEPAGLTGAGLARDLVPLALVITLVGFMESIAIGRVFARRNGYELDANQELIGLGAANIASGLSGGYPVTGGLSRTAVNARAGARTPLASLISAGLVLLTLVAFTPLFADLPTATLAAIVVTAVVGLFDLTEMRRLWTVKRSDFATMTVAFVATLALGIELGIAVAVVVSLAVVFARMSRPHSAELGRVPGTDVYRNRSRFPDAETVPGVVVLRIDAALSFANVTWVKRRIGELRRAHPEARCVVIDCAGVNDLDASAEHALEEIDTELAGAGVTLHLAAVKGPVRDVMRRTGRWDQMHGRLHPDVAAAVACAVGGRSGCGHGLDERACARGCGPAGETTDHEAGAGMASTAPDPRPATAPDPAPPTTSHPRQERTLS